MLHREVSGYQRDRSEPNGYSRADSTVGGCGANWTGRPCRVRTVTRGSDWQHEGDHADPLSGCVGLRLRLTICSGEFTLVVGNSPIENSWRVLHTEGKYHISPWRVTRRLSRISGGWYLRATKYLRLQDRSS